MLIYQDDKKTHNVLEMLISSEVLPTPENTIFSGLIPEDKASFISPFETTSAPDPNFANNEIIYLL